MRKAATVLNALLLVFTAFVLMTDGVATEVPYVVLTLLLLVVPVGTVITLRRGLSTGDPGGRLAVAGDGLLLGFVAWAVAANPGHLADHGVLLYGLAAALAPAASLVALAGAAGRTPRLSEP